jgi:SAM-dependent methyltransferase
MNVLQNWSLSLKSWGIPQEILDQAPQSPWIHPVANFRPEGNLMVETPSRFCALEALASKTNPSVLDVGCGGGRGAFGLTPPAVRVIGVDHQQGMLDVFVDEAKQRGLDVETVLGDWPDVSAQTPIADVVVCHHVYYNVQDIAPFAQALNDHAMTRVVVELPQQHPLSSLSEYWKHFWNLDRPTSPTAHDALDTMKSLGFDAHLELFAVTGSSRAITKEDVEHTRIRLCLPVSRDEEIRTFMESHPAGERKLATIWWDKH